MIDPQFSIIFRVLASFKWTSKFQMGEEVSTGQANFNWTSKFQIDKQVSNGRANFNWTRKFQMDKLETKQPAFSLSVVFL